MEAVYTKKGALKFRKLSKDYKLELLRIMFDILVEADPDHIDLTSISQCVLGTIVRDHYIQTMLNIIPHQGDIFRDYSDPNTRDAEHEFVEEWLLLDNVFQESGLSSFLFGDITEDEDACELGDRPVKVVPGHTQYLEYTQQQLAILRVLTVADMVNRDVKIKRNTPWKTFHKAWNKNFDKLVARSGITPRLVGEDHEDCDDYDD